MSQARVIQLNSAEELLEKAEAWDDLWRRSNVALPTLQAELIDLWLRQFAPRRAFRALVVEDQGRFLAALPLCRRRLKGLLPVVGLTSNPWSICGDLLLDEQDGRQAESLELLVTAAAGSPEALLWLEGIDCQMSRWQAFLAAADRAGLQSDARPIWDVALIDAAMIAGQPNWQAFEAGLSRDFCRNLRRRVRQLEELGTLNLSPHSSYAIPVCDAVRRAFDLEDQSWKGAAGTSVLRAPGMLDFFTRQAELLAARGQLALHFLEVDGQPIAFEYGYLAKGTYFAHKVSYLPQHQKAAPGHVLRWQLLPRLFTEPGFRSVDLFGKVNEAAERWMTRRYTLSRLAICPPRATSRLLMAAVTRWWPKVRPCLGGGP